MSIQASLIQKIRWNRRNFVWTALLGYFFAYPAFRIGYWENGVFGGIGGLVLLLISVSVIAWIFKLVWPDPDDNFAAKYFFVWAFGVLVMLTFGIFWIMLFVPISFNAFSQIFFGVDWFDMGGM